MAGAERLAFGSDNNHAQRLIIFDFVERGGKRREQGFVQGVVAFRPIERKGRDFVPGVAQQNGLVC